MALVLFAPVLVERWLVPTPPEQPPLAITLDLLDVALMPEPPDPPGSLLAPDLPFSLCRVLISIVDVVPLSLSSSTIYTFLGLLVVSFGGILGMLMSLPYAVCSFRIYMPLRVKFQLLSLQCCTADLGMLLLGLLKSLSSNSSLERPPPPPFYRAILIVSLGPSIWHPHLQPPLINFFPPGDSLKPDLVSLRFYIAIHPSLRFSYRIRLPLPKISVSLPKCRYTSGEECFWAVHQLLSGLLSQ
ncbi:unnamed protein product [Arabis nemorensis]|uniref:Uncharacterized protein n=1 Tax=Arabis nemorensis TaxID=586526 RepID=A0A565C5T7_9BRAS|nr:unnamed protein product [Arabis nemorensis]